MPQVKPLLFITALAAGLALGGCGDRNSQAVFSPDSGSHQPGWIRLHAAAAKAGACDSCHGAAGTPGSVSPSCMSAAPVAGFRCHGSDPVSTPDGCLSCHGGPGSGPFGSVAPNRIGSHARHTALPGITCDTCHLGGGSGSAQHGEAAPDGAPAAARVAFPDTFGVYSAPGRAFGYAGATCARISCHGGQETPAWGAAPTLDCLDCHQPGTAQFNSFNSGRHDSHLSRGAACLDCHSAYALRSAQIHFSGLAAGTLIAPGRTVGGTPLLGSYDQADRSCSGVQCHTVAPANGVHWTAQ